MKIQIASDLHLEFLRRTHPAFPVVQPTDADVLVLAGDIANGADGIEAFADWPTPVVYISGNHEFYGGEVHAVQDVLRAASARTGDHVRYLERREAILGGVRFLGCCLWTDYALNGDPEAAMEAAAQFMVDHRKILIGEHPFTARHALALHRESRGWLEAKLREPFAGQTVVVTHHGPHPGSVHPHYADHPANPGFVSDLTPLIGQAALWIHGHTHSSFRYEVKGTAVIANPRGYLRNRAEPDPEKLVFENAEYDPAMVVEV